MFVFSFKFRNLFFKGKFIFFWNLKGLFLVYFFDFLDIFLSLLFVFESIFYKVKLFIGFILVFWEIVVVLFNSVW